MAKRRDFETATDSLSSGDREISRKGIEDVNNSSGAYNFRFVPIEQIVPNELNKHMPQENIERMADSIKIFGLMHNLDVWYDEDNDLYRLVSGERRYRGFCLLKEREPEWFRKNYPNGLPCKIEKRNQEEVDEELHLRIANIEVRNFDPKLVAGDVMRTVELLKLKRATGEISNMQKAMAELLSTTERQAAKYIAAGKIIPELKELFVERKISLNDAEKFSTFSEESQRQIYEMISSGEKVNKSDMEIIRKKEQENERLVKELAEYSRQIEEQKALLEALQSELENKTAAAASEEKGDDRAEDEKRQLEKERDAAIARQKQLQTQMDKMKMTLQEREEKHITITEEERKQYAAYAKLESDISAIESSIADMLKKKPFILKDQDICHKITILANRLSNLLSE